MPNSEKTVVKYWLVVILGHKYRKVSPLFFTKQYLLQHGKICSLHKLERVRIADLIPRFLCPTRSYTIASSRLTLSSFHAITSISSILLISKI